MTQTADQFHRFLDHARRMPAAERDAWVDGLAVGSDLKERLKQALTTDVTIDLVPPSGPAPDLPRPQTRGATLSEKQAGSSSIAIASESQCATAVRSGGATEADPMLGRTFAGVVIERILGSGGMGRVYLGTDGPGGRQVALKVLLRTQRDDNVRKRFEREARLLQTLRHPGIAAVLRTGVEEDGDVDIPYIVMEYVEGVMSITDYVFKQRLGIRDAVQLYVQVCDAVGFAHAQGYMHRDLKPANILVNRQGQVKVIDFGVARAVQVDSAAVTVRTETGQIVGTMQYMSPEQFKADPRLVDKRSDVYALSAVLYEVLTGIQPLDLRGMPVHEAARIVCETDAPDVRQCNPRVDARLAEILADGLSRDVTRRPDDARALGRQLKAWITAPAPTIEATIHPIHPDMETLARQKARQVRETARGGTPVPGSVRRIPRSVRASRKSGWTGIMLLAGAAVFGVLVALDVVPMRVLVERVRSWTSAVRAVHAEEQPLPAELPGPTEGTEVRQIRVVTAPEGASVRVNSEPRGLAPAIVLGEVVPGGSLLVEAVKDGWQPASMQWTEGKDDALVVFNLAPLTEGATLQRAFVLDVAKLPKGARLRVTSPTAMPLNAGAEAVLVDFARREDGQWQSSVIKFEAVDASGQPLNLQVGARRGRGTLEYDVKPEDARSRLRVRVQ